MLTLEQNGLLEQPQCSSHVRVLPQGCAGAKVPGSPKPTHRSGEAGEQRGTYPHLRLLATPRDPPTSSSTENMPCASCEALGQMKTGIW